MAPPVVAPACPRCSAAVRPGAPWCTQCYAPLADGADGADVDHRVDRIDRVDPQREPTTPPTREAAGEVGGPARWPCGACGTANDLGADACASCGTGFLARLREEQAPVLVLPVVGDLAALRRGQRVGLALAFVLAVLLVSAVLVALTG